jgi:UDP-N-acetylmuramoylalanine-D-glutamate ligase
MYFSKVKNNKLSLVRYSSTTSKTSHKYVTPDIGFIGLGEMGFRMANNLIKAGKNIIVYDKSSKPVEILQQQGAVSAQNPKEV